MIDARYDAYPAADGRNGLGLWQRALLTAAWVLVGGSSVILGLYLGSMNATAYKAERGVSVFSGTVIIGGIILIAQARQQSRPSRAGWIAGTAIAVVGLLISMVTPIQQTCCDAAWIVSLGLPLAWTTGHGDTWSQAVGDAWRGTWDPASAIANAIFWAFAGMIVAIMIGLLRRAKRPSS